jgi:hypothetical protein
MREMRHSRTWYRLVSNRRITQILAHFRVHYSLLGQGVRPWPQHHTYTRHECRGGIRNWTTCEGIYGASSLGHMGTGHINQRSGARITS